MSRSGGNFTPPLPRALSNTLMKISAREQSRSPPVIAISAILLSILGSLWVKIGFMLIFEKIALVFFVRCMEIIAAEPPVNVDTVG